MSYHRLPDLPGCGGWHLISHRAPFARVAQFTVRTPAPAAEAILRIAEVSGLAGDAA